MKRASPLTRIFSPLLRELAGREAGTRAGIDPEELHQMRNAARRLRVLLAFFAPALPARAVVKASAELRWLGAVLGQCRDWDVYLLSLAGRLANQGVSEADIEVFELRNGAVAAREVAHAAVRRALASPRYRSLRADLGRLPLPPLPRAGRTLILPPRETFEGFLLRRLSRSLLRLRADLALLDPEVPPVKLHDLRRLCRRHRYLFEALAPFARDLAAPAARARDLQDALGIVQDSVAARALGARLARATRGRVSRVLRAIETELAEEAARARREIPRARKRLLAAIGRDAAVEALL